MGPAATPHPASDYAFEREVRFAVVIYGGVSLAIYINGVVQQLLSMVRATTKRIPPAQLNNVERVYRQLACGIGRSEIVPHGQRLNEPGKVGLVHSTAESAIALTHHSAAEPRTRFVVDILTGTSAGGINAIYLAKALAHGTDLETLARMWITEADLSRLLNDKQITPAYLRQTANPPSLLNSRWMYLKLLDALAGMNDKPGVGPLVEDLDLYCTTTDLRGVPITLPLTDKTVTEYRYKSDFFFKRRPSDPDTLDDFDINMDPFFAFVARCTSSFPVAFEPMTLDDILPALQREPRFQRYLNPAINPAPPAPPTIFGASTPAGRLRAAEAFEHTCPIYGTPEAAGNAPFPQRPFADGGYLQNKPFSYAIETLKTRSATLPVDRKLVYIEPEPAEITQPPADSGLPVQRPNAIQNGLDALSTLPRYQTIQQDIQSVVDWNSNIAHLQDVLGSLRGTLDEIPSDAAALNPESLSYRSYIRLRLSGAADQLTSRVAAAMNAGVDSSQGTAIRLLVGKWRDRNFAKLGGYVAPGPTRSTEDFLSLFDFDFLRRALRYMRSELQKPERINAEGNMDRMRQLAELTRRWNALVNDDPGFDLTLLNSQAYPAWLACVRFMVDPRVAQLVLPTSELNSNLLLSATDAGCSKRVDFLFEHPDFPFAFIQDHGIARSLAALGHYDARDPVFDPGPLGADARRNLWQSNDDNILAALGAFSFRTILAFIEKQLANAFGNSAADSKLGAILSDLLSEPFASAPGVWERFLVQDTVMYPIVFGTPLGEFETVDIFRISPDDTATLTEEGTDQSSTARPRLKGDTLDAFGGFLDQSWRLNDMLRGHLDGAERLITAILPDADPQTIAYREHFIKLAQEAIAEDWVNFECNLSAAGLLDTPKKDGDHAYTPAQ